MVGIYHSERLCHNVALTDKKSVRPIVLPRGGCSDDAGAGVGGRNQYLDTFIREPVVGEVHLLNGAALLDEIGQRNRATVIDVILEELHVLARRDICLFSERIFFSTCEVNNR